VRAHALTISWIGKRMTNEFKARNGIITPTVTSTVSTGTAPLIVTSTTKVDNLNADLLDGKHASEFQLAVAGSAQVVVSNTQPVGLEKYLWIQTGLGSSGTDFTFWFEDGVPA